MQHTIRVPVSLTLAQINILKELKIISDFWFTNSTEELKIKYSSDIIETYEVRRKNAYFPETYFLIP